MSKAKETAGKTASGTGIIDLIRAGGEASSWEKRSNRWHMVYRKGCAFLESPSGECYAGTAAEVRRLALAPTYRDRLAGSLRITRTTYPTPDRFEARRESAAEARRTMIMRDGMARTHKQQERNDMIIAGAAARLFGETLPEFRRAALLGAIEAAFDVYYSEHGAYGLPLTRQERAALTCDISCYCPAMQLAGNAAFADAIKRATA